MQNDPTRLIIQNEHCLVIQPCLARELGKSPGPVLK